MYAFWREWFAQPEAKKTKHLRSPGKGGWYPPYSETPGYTGNKDPKEYFHYRTSHEGLDRSGSTSKVFWDCYRKAKEWLQRNALLPQLDFQAGNCVLRILHYLPTPDGQVGEAHCDFDLLTVSIPGTVPGLEVWDPYASIDGWVRHEVLEVHVGEMLTHYAGIPATPHRVRTTPNTERYKAVFFYLPPNNFELKPGFTAGDYLKDVLAKAGTAEIGMAK